MIRAVPETLALALMLVATGCAGHGPAPEAAPTTAQRLDRLERDVAALQSRFRAAAPGIDRLVGMEEDIRALLDQLAAIPGAPVQGDGVRVPAGAMQTGAQTGLSGPAPLDPTLETGRHGMHLASYRERTQVAAGWRQVRAQLGTDLAGLSPRVTGIDFGDGRGTFYRLKAGPLADAEAARALCGKVRARGAFCDVTDFSGTPGEAFWRDLGDERRTPVQPAS